MDRDVDINALLLAEGQAAGQTAALPGIQTAIAAPPARIEVLMADLCETQRR